MVCLDPESMNGYADSCSDPGPTGFTEPDHYSAPETMAEFRRGRLNDPGCVDERIVHGSIGAPYVRDSATSKEAATRIIPHLGELQSRVYAALQERPDTTDGLEVRLGLPHQTVSPRVVELTRKKLIRKTIRTALTRSQRRAFVYEVVEVKP